MEDSILFTKTYEIYKTKIKKNLAAISFLKVDKEMTIIFEVLFLQVFTTHLLFHIMGEKGIFINNARQWKVSYMMYSHIILM